MIVQKSNGKNTEVSFDLAVTPDSLRKIANELEAASRSAVKGQTIRFRFNESFSFYYKAETNNENSQKSVSIQDGQD